ncbi:DUF2931 family protein [Cedecea colo]|uniref:DUF2931 family protein n=1 Tax=Cedecea colo TaxID=2552946 RepID=UPI00308401E9
MDKKVYETTLVFSSEPKNKMLTTEPSNYNSEDTCYFQYIVIGLAPEGKVRVWLKTMVDLILNKQALKSQRFRVMN